MANLFERFTAKLVVIVIEIRLQVTLRTITVARLNADA